MLLKTPARGLIIALVTLLCLYIVVGASKIHHLFRSARNQWEKSIATCIDDTFDIIIPDEDRRKWAVIESTRGSLEGHLNKGVRTVWAPKSKGQSDKSRRLSIIYFCRPVPHGIGKFRQYTSIHEAIEQVKEGAKADTSLSFAFNNDRDVFIEKERRNEQGSIQSRSIGRVVLQEDWVVAVWYKVNSNPDNPGINVSWEEEKAQWIDRFSHLRWLENLGDMPLLTRNEQGREL
jgi:hypothetical protein